MNIDVTSLLWAALLIGAQIVVIYVLAKILSKLNDKILPDKESR